MTETTESKIRNLLQAIISNAESIAADIDGPQWMDPDTAREVERHLRMVASEIDHIAAGVYAERCDD
jgi:hypothetical protein